MRDVNPELELDRELRDLAARVDVHVADDPHLADRVVATIETAGFATPDARRRRERVVIATLVALLVGGTVSAGPAVAEWVRDRIGGVEIERPSTPTDAPALGATLDLGAHVTLGEARAAVPFELLTRRGGPAPEVWLDRVGNVPVVSLLYADALVQQFAAPLAEPALMRKRVGAGTVVDEVEVRGQDGVWFGGGHAIAVGSGDSYTFAPDRLSANALVWEERGVTIRVESALGRHAVAAIAASLR